MDNPKLEELRRKIALIETYTPELTAYWATTIPCDPPAHYVISQWLTRFDPDSIVAGIDAYSRLVAKKDKREADDVDTGPEVTTQNAIRYISGTCWKIKRGDTYEQARKFGDGTPYPAGWDTLDDNAKRQLIAQHRGGVQ